MPRLPTMVSHIEQKPEVQFVKVGSIGETLYGASWAMISHRFSSSAFACRLKKPRDPAYRLVYHDAEASYPGFAAYKS